MKGKRIIALFVILVVVWVSLAPTDTRAYDKSLQLLSIRYSGPFTNTTLNLSGEVIIDLTVDTANSASGYINFTNYPYVNTLCGAGYFTGTLQGSSLNVSFLSDDPDQGCGFDKGWLFTVSAQVSSDKSILSLGTYQAVGQQGIFRATSTNAQNDWININKIENLYESRRGTPEAAYAHQYLCLARKAGDEYRISGKDGWAGGFIKHLFDYMDTHNQGNRGLDITCDPALFVEGWGCFEKAGDVHFTDELQPGFASYCLNAASEPDYQKWNADHEAFLSNTVDACYDEVVASNELPDWFAGYAKSQIKIRARNLRQMTQIGCRQLFAPKNILAKDSAASNNNATITLPPSPTEAQLFSPAIPANTMLSVTATSGKFFLPVGSTVQLKVTSKSDPKVDLSAASTGTRYTLGEGVDYASISPDGSLVISLTPSSLVSVTPMLHIFVTHGKDFGVGQFTIVDTDIDADLMVDSYEIFNELDPRVSNLTFDSDVDEVMDLLELMLQTNPKLADSDGDMYSDAFEIYASSDPINPKCTPIQGCIDTIYLTQIRQSK